MFLVAGILEIWNLWPKNVLRELDKKISVRLSRYEILWSIYDIFKVIYAI